MVTEARIHKVIAKSIGLSVAVENKAKIAPMTAPVAKRNIPISELAVPAVRGNRASTAVLALLEPHPKDTFGAQAADKATGKEGGHHHHPYIKDEKIAKMLGCYAIDPGID